MSGDTVGACVHAGTTATAAVRIPALLNELDRCPDDRGEIVFEIAAEFERPVITSLPYSGCRRWSRPVAWTAR